MRQCTILAVLGVLTAFGLLQQASAQAIPNIQGMQAFSAQAKYMSLAGNLRWQYFMTNNVWISHMEAEELVSAQMQTNR